MTQGEHLPAAWQPAWQHFERLLVTPGLDDRVARDPSLLAPLHGVLDEIDHAWSAGACAGADALSVARLFGQRVLYRLNRLRLYWFDAPEVYVNERSRALCELQDRVEMPWQAWLASQVALDESALENPLATVRSWAASDREPADTPAYRFFAQEVNRAGYERLLLIASLNGLVEASQLSRVLGGAAGEVQCMLTRILFEEYGGGRPARKHSTYFGAMLQQLGLSAEPEAYFDCVPWEVLAAVNQSFYLTENKRCFIRFCGAFTYTETSTPASFHGYAAAARRLGLATDGDDYWSLHIREDARHGPWMVEQVAKPMLDRFPGHARELLLGYLHQRFVESEAARATLTACQAAAHGRAAA